MRNPPLTTRRATDLNWTRPALLASGGSAKLSVADARGVCRQWIHPTRSARGSEPFSSLFDLLRLNHRGASVRFQTYERVAGLGTPHMDGNTRLCTATAAAALKET